MNNKNPEKNELVIHEMELPPEYNEEKGEWSFNARAAFVFRDRPSIVTLIDISAS